MKQKRKKVLCIDSDSTFLKKQEEILGQRELDNYFFPFDNFRKAVQFIEKDVISNGEHVHYILLDEKIPGKKLTDSLEKISSFKTYLKEPDVIVSTDKSNDELRNVVMQYPFVSAFLVKPIPEKYIQFLITGQSA
jgi:response regulator RpfG family c-di-GMP phosphodiesterase